MNMLVYIDQIWMWFCIASGVALLLTCYMAQAGAHLMTRDGSLRAFTVMDLEFPSNPLDIPNLINGIYKLPDADQQGKVIRALKRVLYADYLFMLAVYSAIFLICMQVSIKLDDAPIGRAFFAIFAWLQIVAWICDILENAYLLRCIRPKLIPSSQRIHLTYVVIVWGKWAIALIGGISALMMMIYFWMKGDYATSTLPWIGIYILEIIIFLVVMMAFSGKKKASSRKN